MVGEGKKLSAKSKVDFSRLPPCLAALVPHLQRVNHRCALYKRANIPFVESPKPYEANQGWVNNDGLLEPLWSNEPILPALLVDLLEAGEVQKADEGDEMEYAEDDDGED